MKNELINFIFEPYVITMELHNFCIDEIIYQIKKNTNDKWICRR